MIRVAIVDDEIQVLQFLKDKTNEIAHELDVELSIELFDNGKNMLKRNSANEFHIIMLDLEMPYYNGLEISRDIRKTHPNIVLIFITNRSDLVFQSFEYDVTGFVRKSHIDELKGVMDRACQKVFDKKLSYVLKTDNGEKVYQSVSICFFASKGHNIMMFDEKNNATKIHSTLDKLEKILSPKIFVRCHSGLIVNCGYIFSIGKDYIELTNHEKIALSRHRSKKVKEVFQRYLRGV